MWLTLFHYAFGPEGPRQKSFVGSRSSPQKCKFCGKQEPSVTFRKVSHIVPAAFGNRTLFSHEECDTCNEHVGSPLESDLASLFSLERALARKRTRSGGMKLRHQNRENYIESGSSSDDVRISLVADEPEISVHLVGEREAELTVELPPHRPVNAIKALARMALFVMPDCNEPALRHALQWVRGEATQLPVRYFSAFLPGTGLKDVRLVVGRTTELPEPLHFVMFWFSTKILAMYLPDPEKGLPEQLPLLPIPNASPFPPHTITQRERCLTSDKVVKGAKRSATIAFSEARGDVEGAREFLTKK